LRVFENSVLRRIFGPETEKVVGVWERLRNEELHNLYAPANIIRVIKSKIMRWTEHVARMREMHTKFWVENLKGRDHSENLGTGEK
jgi:hypothetical protein